MRELAGALSRLSEFRLHPLGFFYLHQQLERPLGLRVHVWLPNDFEVQTNERHTHSYDFESHVVAGKISNELFQFRSVLDGEAREFAVSYKGDKSYLQTDGRCGVLEHVASFEVSAGELYRLDAGTVHRVKAVSTPSVTVVRTYERRFPIYSYGSSEDALAFNRRVVNAGEMRSIGTVLQQALLG